MSNPNPPKLHEDAHSGSSTADPMELVMAQMTAEQLKLATGGVLISGSPGSVVSGISIDTRTMHPGDLFFAIRGAQNDGHNYVARAMEKGASGAVVDSRYVPPHDFPQGRLLLQVHNTHEALKSVAAEVRRCWRGSLVGITGSMGKTTTKEFCGHVLQTEYSVYRSPGNFNNLFGLPLALFGLSPNDHIGLFEMGMSAPGEIAEMCRIATPDIGIITNVAAVHLAFFNAIEDIARAKGELARGLSPEGVLVYNLDDPLVKSMIADRFPGKKISFGLSGSADVRAEAIEMAGLQETRFQVCHSGVTWPASLPVAGEHYVMNALPAIALGIHYRMGMEQIIESLHNVQPGEMRGRIMNFPEGFALIDDSYNSNPRALMQMCKLLAALPRYQRRILVAGEMLELGHSSEALHYQCGEFAAQCRLDAVVAIQGAARELARGAVEAGISRDQVHFFTEVNPATDFISRQIESGDLLLIKGSRGVHLERMVEYLQENRGRYPISR